MSTIIQTNQLSKSYGRSRGIIDVTFMMWRSPSPARLL